MNLTILLFMDCKTNLILGNYNITLSFFTDPKDSKDEKSKMPHAWLNRKKYFKNAIEQSKVDILALQEVAPDQALDIINMFPNYKFYFYTHAQTDDVKAGSIYSTTDEIKKHLVGKFIGTPGVIGIMYNPKVVTAIKTGIFWYNEKPFEVPTTTDRSLTDKGFGNMNTPRGAGYVQFIHNSTKNEFYFFSSHAPISGGGTTRMKCFEKENEVILKLTNGLPFFSVGDRNLFPDEEPTKVYNALVPHGVFDWMNTKNHKGQHNTWLGFLYEKKEFQNQITQDGKFTEQKILDIGTSSIKSDWSAHYHCIIRDNNIELLGKITEEDNISRNFLSDHSMVVAGFSL